MKINFAMMLNADLYKCHVLWRDFEYRKCWGETFMAHPVGKHSVCQPTEPFAVKIRQDLLSGCFRIGPMWCHSILPPFRTNKVHWTLLYKLIGSLLWNFSQIAFWGLMGKEWHKVGLIPPHLRCYSPLHPHHHAHPPAAVLSAPSSGIH